MNETPCWFTTILPRGGSSLVKRGVLPPSPVEVKAVDGQGKVQGRGFIGEIDPQLLADLLMACPQPFGDAEVYFLDDERGEWVGLADLTLAETFP